MPESQKSASTPLVSSVSTQLKKTIPINDTQVVSVEELKDKKQKLLNIIDTATDQFIQNLADKKVELTSSLDLERLVKLTLLLSGEAESITGSSVHQAEVSTSVGVNNAEISMSKINEILNLDDPEVKSMFDKIYEGYNQLNDQE